MKNDLRKPFGLGLILLQLLTVVSASVANAYVPQSWFIIKSVAAKKKGFKTLRIRSRIQPLDSSQSWLIREVFTVDYASGRAVSRLFTDAGDEISIKEMKGWEGAGVGSLLTVSGRIELLTEALKKLQLPIRTEEEVLGEKLKTTAEPEAVSFVRFNQTIAWAIGKKGSEPQLLIEKDTFLPLRFLGEVAAKKIDVQYEKYRVNQEFSYPEQATLFIGEQGYRLTTDELAVNIDLVEPKKPAHSQATNGATGTMNTAGTAVTTDARDFAQSWFRWYR